MKPSWLKGRRRFSRHRLDASHEHRRIFTALISVTFFIGFAKAIGAIKEIAIAATYGTSPTVDAYVFLMNLLSWPGAVLSSSFIAVLVPFIIKLQGNRQDSLIKFKRELITTLSLAGIAAAIIIYIILDAVLSQKTYGLAPTANRLIADMLPWMIFAVPISFVAAFLAANLMATHRHTNTMLECVPALVLLVLIVSFQLHTASSLACATLIGLLVHLSLLFAAQHEKAITFFPQFTFAAAEWRLFSRGIAIVIAGQALTSVTSVIDQIMVAPLGAGANATLGYSSRLLSLLMGLGATAIARALLPVLADTLTAQPHRTEKVATQWMLLLFLAGVALAVLAFVFAEPAIRILFERGAFTPGDTVAVAVVFQHGVFQLPFYFAGVVVVQLIASRGDYRAFIYVGALNLVVKLIGNALFIPWLGISGVMVSNTLIYLFSFPALLMMARR